MVPALAESRPLRNRPESYLEKGPSRVSPFFIPMMIPDMGSGYVSIVTGAKGPNHTVVTACASASHSIGRFVPDYSKR